MSLEIIYYPHPTLRHPSRPIMRVDAQLRRWFSEMLELMYENKGVGLAANQVDLPYRFFVMNTEGDPDIKEAEHVFINPVLSGGKGTAEGEEGCLSIPDIYAPVIRNERIKVQAYNIRGEEICTEIDGLFARIVQHETDHLDGTLFIDRLSPTQMADIRPQLEELEDVFENQQKTGAIPSNDMIATQLAELESMRT
ncbi:MAG: peptide deformylase [Pirellulales bacterium]|nr:peptide deformylase [Pirellulales bacterium]